jgi:hypothetical protein
MNDIVDRAFAALPPPVPHPGDAATARQIWLRARIAAMVEDSRIEGLRAGSDLLTIAALDAIAPLVAFGFGAPPMVVLAVLVATHSVVSLGVLRVES